MKNHGLLLLLALMLLASCGGKDEVKKPEMLLSEQQMIDVLTDSYLIEAELNQKKSTGESVGELQDTYYNQLFEHYGINDTVFEQNMRYYSYQLPVLERIMDSVTNRFLRANQRQ